MLSCSLQNAIANIYVVKAGEAEYPGVWDEESGTADEVVHDEKVVTVDEGAGDVEEEEDHHDGEEDGGQPGLPHC